MQGVIDLGRVLFAPSAVFGEMREKPRILGGLVALLIAQVILVFLSGPFIRVGMQAQVASRPEMQGEQLEGAARMAEIFGVIGAPIGLLIVLLIGTVLLWILVSVVGGDAKFKHLFAVSVYGYVPALLLGLVGLLILSLRGAESITSMQDLQPSVGIDLFVSRVADLGGFTTSFLKAINPFGIWQLVLVAIGIERTHDVSKGAAYTASIIAFLVMAMVGAVFAGFGQS